MSIKETDVHKLSKPVLEVTNLGNKNIDSIVDLYRAVVTIYIHYMPSTQFNGMKCFIKVKIKIINY